MSKTVLRAVEKQKFFPLGTSSMFVGKIKSLQIYFHATW